MANRIRADVRFLKREPLVYFTVISFPPALLKQSGAPAGGRGYAVPRIGKPGLAPVLLLTKPCRYSWHATVAGSNVRFCRPT